MKSRFCFCFKRNRASYNISSEHISYTNSNAIISTIPSVCQQINTDNEYPTSTKTTSNDQINRIPKHLSQPTLEEDFSELYATVDKTRQAKNSIKVVPDTNRFSASTSTTSSRPVSLLNSYSSEHPSRSKSLYTNVPVNTRTSNYDRTSNHHRSYCEGVTLQERQPSRNSWMSREHKTSGSSDLYAEIVNGNHMADNTSERYATIK